MKRERSAEIGAALNDHHRWGSHSRGINMATLREDLKLKIEDYGADQELKALVLDYLRLVRELGYTSFVHSQAFI